MVFRASKGRAFFDSFEFELKENSQKKRIFLIVFPGSEEDVLKTRMMKICDIFNSSRYKIPLINEYDIEFNNLIHDLEQQEMILKQSKTATIKFIREKLGNVSNYIVNYK